MYTLITAANSAQAYRLKTRLGADNIVLGDYLDLPDIMVRSGKMLRLPDPHNPSYPHQMLALCLDKNISQVHVLRKEEAGQLLNAKTLFSEYGIGILAADDPL
ncbi:MAG TPA: hypothetical protein VHS53_02995 [Mucilaginibacter sp.]|jgi:hypothetical protein|nr:hypothetical protein [Mucilaginibacter sp.]